MTSYENGAGQTVTYSYDDDGDTKSITYPLGAGATWATGDTVDYDYDDADELDSVTDFNGNTIPIDNTADGLPYQLTLGATGDTQTTTYDATDTPSEINVSDADSDTVIDFSYSDAPSGSISDDDTYPDYDNDAAYDYDNQDRVIEMGTSTEADYSFDASGNLTTLPDGSTATYDDASELTSSTLSDTTTTDTYDADGERTQQAQGESTIMSASYNGAQELTAYSDSAADMTSASYDGDGLRQSETSTPTGGSSATEDFTWDTRASLPKLLMDSDNAYIYATGNTPVEQVDLSTGTVSYLVADMLGSVRGIIDSSDGTLTASAEYDAWGNPETSGGLTAYTPLGYGGSYSDPTGLVYLTNRYYDPMTGQFLTVDPLVDKTDQAYAYADDNPVVSTDLLGLSCGLFSVGDCLQDAIGYGTHEIEEHAGGIAAATSTAAIVLSFTGVGEPLVPILEGVSAVTGSLGSGKDLAEGNYATAVLDFGGAALGAGGFSLGQLAARLDAGGPALNDAVDELAETIAGGEGTSIDQEELASLIQARRDLRLLAEERQGQGATADVYAAALALVGLC